METRPGGPMEPLAAPTPEDARQQGDRPKRRLARSVLSSPAVWRARRPLADSVGSPGVLVEALGEVASAVSSTRPIEDVLGTILDRTKTATGAEKAVLCLFEESAEWAGAEPSLMLVRGSRAECPESWWREQFDLLVEASDLESEVLVSRQDIAGTLLCVPIRTHGRCIGLLTAMHSRSRRFNEGQETLLAIFGGFAGAAIENARLLEQAQQSLLAGERTRIANEIHDGLAQTLFSASLNLELSRKRLASEPELASAQIRAVQEQLSESLAELRRFIYDLRPARVERDGLIGAIDTRLAEVSKQTRLRCSLDVQGQPRPLPASAETCLFRVAQEAVSNVVKHARASSIEVRLAFGHRAVELSVSDDGRGFEIAHTVARAERGGSVGLCSMRDRVRSEGGRFRLRSGAGSGTEVLVTLPC